MASRNGSIEKIIRKDEKEKNKGGRPTGVPTQKNKMLREMIEDFTNDNFSVFEVKMNEIEKPEMYAKLYLELLSFRMPKLKSIDFRGEISNNSLEEKMRLLHKNTMSEMEKMSKEERDNFDKEVEKEEDKYRE